MQKRKGIRVALKGSERRVVEHALEHERAEVVTELLKERRARWKLYAKRRRQGGG